jgi:superfamily II DNA or RNA helicase
MSRSEPPRRSKASTPGTRSWRELTRREVHPAFSQRPRESALCFLIDLDSGGTAPRVNLGSREPTLNLVLATRARDHTAAFDGVTPLSVVPRAPFPPGAAGIVCELAASSTSPVVSLTRSMCEELLLPLCRAGLVYGVREGDLERARLLRASSAASFRVSLEAQTPDDAGAPVEFTGRIQRSTPLGEETLAPTRIEALLEVGYVVAGGEITKLEADCVPWVVRLRQGSVEVPRAELPQFLGALAALPQGPRISNVEDVGFSLRAEKPQPVLRLTTSIDNSRLLRGTLVFRYPKSSSSEGSSAWELGCDMRPETLVDREQRLLVQRDFAEESAVIERLGAAGFGVTVWEAETPDCPFDVRVHFDDFVRACEVLMADGFRVELDGSLCRRARGFQAFINSEQDWFELSGNARFDRNHLALPELLEHVRKRDRFVRLSDESLGVLPEKWFAEFDPLASLVNPKHEKLRFHALQALLVDGLLGSWSPAADHDFGKMQERVRAFEGPSALHEPAGFRGELRAYQRVALGWLSALDELGLGGCLADDMGLGKTVVVLAWLWLRVTSGKARRTPSLLVAPKSLLFNWRSEARNFTPELKVLLHHGADRAPPSEHFLEYDLVLTSYGTLRKDASALAALGFDYVILDEAHAIKNAESLAHRSARRLSSRARLALTGTPVENHLLELWSLLCFLNPGVMELFEHQRRTFERARPSEIALRGVVHKLVRPFVLRRTKAEVAPELPARIEKTLYVPLSGAQAVVYRELADHYRARMLERREQRKYIGKAMSGVSHHNGHEAAQALEALLRLRQAACHPALLCGSDVDLESPAARAATAANAPSAKLDLLLERLTALCEGGHKALVFSQFVGFLRLVRTALEERGMPFEYMDGDTRDRESVVARFQNQDGACVFLISLKTGGTGLNLTAAEYVFILDPWWNPAVEAQAVDRAHRIGQTKPVIAYRLLTKGTVEAKVASLQSDKRALTDAVFTGEGTFSSKLTREDFEYLLS